MSSTISLDNTRPTKLFFCPNCKRKTLKRYWDSEKKAYLPLEFGRCNRQDNCGYHQKPVYFSESWQISKAWQPKPCPKEIPSFLDSSLVAKSFDRNLPNYFVDYIASLFREDIAQQLVQGFCISPSNHWQGATIFWQIDEKYKVRSGKVMLYNPQTGKRVKEPFARIHWVHTLLKVPDFHLAQCFFGLHQLTQHSSLKEVCVVESEKTAILLTAIDPTRIWLASGGINLPLDHFRALKRYNVCLFPDSGVDKGQGTPYQRWQEVAKQLSLKGYHISVSDFIEKNVSSDQRIQGYDLADLLIRTDESGLAMSDHDYPLFWDL